MIMSDRKIKIHRLFLCLKLKRKASINQNRYLTKRSLARLAGACPISYPYSFGALPLIFLQLFNYAERGWRKRARFPAYSASERSPFLLLFLSERYTKQFLKSLPSILSILPSGTPWKSTIFISFLSFKPLKIPFR